MIVARLQEALLETTIVRTPLEVALLSRGAALLAAGRLYRGLNDVSRAYRVSRQGLVRAPARRIVFRTIEAIRRDGRNHIVDSYRATRAAASCAALYTLAGGPHDLFRDLIVLKRARPGEKGVILLKYMRTFDAVVSLFDLAGLMERYVFALEPCWTGYCDPSLLMYLAPGHPVVVQCFTKEDEEFVSAIGAPFVPVRLGPADWVDADLFAPPSPDTAKEHDLVMVANWASHKRHVQLFRALRAIDRPVRVLLIGFPWGGRTADDVKREAASLSNGYVTIDVMERLPAHEVARHVGCSKVFVFLSRKEGDNKALVEAMFADVPAIVYRRTIGGASGRINPLTGVLASDDELGERIRFMLDHWREFTPRAWALEHSGSANATRMLDEALRRSVVAAGGRYTEGIVEKLNSPNLTYRDPAARAWFQADYRHILRCLRRPYAGGRNAVA